MERDRNESVEVTGYTGDREQRVDERFGKVPSVAILELVDRGAQGPAKEKSTGH